MASAEADSHTLDKCNEHYVSSLAESIPGGEGVPEAGLDAKRGDRIATDASRSLNPHAVAGIHLSGVCVYQFRHSGTSAKTAKL